jgi:hypothetical protein
VPLLPLFPQSPSLEDLAAIAPARTTPVAIIRSATAVIMPAATAHPTRVATTRIRARVTITVTTSQAENHVMHFARWIVLVAAVATMPAQATAFCSEPQPPSCLSFGDVDEFCRQQVENYLREVAAHAQCVVDADQKDREAAIRKWNCRIKGNSYCY